MKRSSKTKNEPAQSYKSNSSTRNGNINFLLMFAIIVALVAGGAIWWIFGRGGKSITTSMVYTVKRADFRMEVTERGEIQSSNDVEIRCAVKAKNTSGTSIISLAPEGEFVKKGDFLVQLDSSALESDRTTQLIAVNSSEAARISAENLYKTALISKPEYLEGTYVQERQTIEGEIFVAEENVSRAKEYYIYSQSLATKGHITEQQLEADRFAVENSRKLLEAAQTKLRILKQFTKNKMLTELENAILSAKASWKAEESKYDLEKSKLDDIQNQIDNCTIKAPSDGVVMYAHVEGRRNNGEFIVEPGAIVRERQVIIRLPNKSEMRVKLKVNESLIKYVKTGAEVVIRPVGFGKMTIQGEVERVNEFSEPSGWRKANVKEYGTFVKILGDTELLRSGMTASVTIECDFIADVLQVPVQALYSHGKDAYCFVKDGNKWIPRKVKRGTTNDQFFVIKDGLKENDIVALNPQKIVEQLDLPELQKNSDDEKQQMPNGKRPGPNKPTGRPRSTPKQGKQPIAKTASKLEATSAGSATGEASP